MDGNFRIGRFGGIEVRLSWSLLAVFALIVWSLTDGVFPSQNPGLSHGSYLAMGIVAAVLFLASILLHELGHRRAGRTTCSRRSGKSSVVARRRLRSFASGSS
jgi:Zn-dependent protease